MPTMSSKTMFEEMKNLTKEEREQYLRPRINEDIKTGKFFKDADTQAKIGSTVINIIMLAVGAMPSDDKLAFEVAEAVSEAIIVGQVKALEAMIDGTMTTAEEFEVLALSELELVTTKYSDQGAALSAAREARLVHLETQQAAMSEELARMRNRLYIVQRKDGV